MNIHGLESYDNGVQTTYNVLTSSYDSHINVYDWREYMGSNQSLCSIPAQVWCMGWKRECIVSIM